MSINAFLGIIQQVANVSEILIDSYSESNYSTDHATGGGVTNKAGGQCFTSAYNKDITKADFYIWKNGSPTGNIVAKLYATTGTVGTDATPTGSVLATSDTVDITTISSVAPALVTFDFSTTYSIVNGNDYWIGLEFTGGDASNYLLIGVDNSSPTHSGNGARQRTSTSAWVVPAADYCFYLYGE